MSEYYLTNKELYHYGIKGQRWGTRRWQNDDGSFNEEGKIRYGRISDEKKKKLAEAKSDYRKAKRQSSKAEFRYILRTQNPVYDIPGKHKAKTKKIEDKVYSTYKKELLAYDKYKKLKDEYKNNGKEERNLNISNNEKPRQDGEYSKDAAYYKKRGTAQLALMATAGVLSAAYSAYVIYKNRGKAYYDDINLSNDLYSVLTGGIAVYKAVKSFKQRSSDKKLLENSEFKKVEDIPKSKTDYSKNYFNSKEDGAKASKELRHNVNPGYPNTGSNRNCMLCTTALVMRLKGYDVQANTINDGFEAYKPEDWFKNCSVKKVNKKSSPLDLERELKSQGNGSYGNLMVTWKKSIGGSGHSILYTVRNGKVEFIDGQANQTYSLEKLFRWVDMNDVSYINLTNAVPKDIVAGLVKSNK